MTNGTSDNFSSNDQLKSQSFYITKYNDDNNFIKNSRNIDYDNTERCINDYSESPRNNNDILDINIYRYKFTEEFTNEMYKFSKIHQYDHRNDFKEAWNKWIEVNEEIVRIEFNRLNDMGYNGDIFDKMFKSARYYFRKKSTEKSEPKPRRTYVGSQKELLEAMDEHIINNIKKEDYKPSIAFNEFCQENINLLQEEVSRLCKCGFTDKNDIKNKVKKTYKNRYFIISKNN